MTFNAHYAYAFVERVLDVPNNRSDATLSADWRVTPKMSVRALASFQRTHGGFRSGSLPGSAFPAPGDLTTPERIAEHDRLLRDNSTHLGAGMAYQFSPVGVFVAYTHFVSGTDTHAGRALTTGVTWPFHLRQ